MARIVRCTIEMELVEGRDFESPPKTTPEELEDDILIFNAEEAFVEYIRDREDFDWEYVQSKIIEEAS